MRIFIETVNKIRADPLSHRQFRELFKRSMQKMKIDGDLIFYSHVRWLSCGKAHEIFQIKRRNRPVFDH
jgi:hypothetical protein